MGNKFVSIKVILIFFAFLIPIQCKKRIYNKNVNISLYSLLICNKSKGNINLDSQILDTVKNNYLIKEKSNLELIDDDLPLRLIDTLIYYYVNSRSLKVNIF
ncbi:MAG TPA: hypothetical protein PK783_10715 [Chitinophagales bacterium]|nr:hypothetical protein [Chitinophagales bacterium]